MAPRPEILLSSQIDFVSTEEIPRLIAEALHPDLADTPRVITRLDKSPKSEASAETLGWPMDDRDRKILEEIWTGLPPLVLPITEEAWQPYVEAFEHRGQHLDWHLTWLVSDPSLNAAILRHAAKEEHEKALQSAIQDGELSPISATTRLPVGSERGSVVSVEALSQYVAKFHIAVRTAVLVTKPHTTAGNRTTVGKPVSRSEAQEQAILGVIAARGLDPLTLPKAIPGKTGIKNSVWLELKGQKAVFSSWGVFNKAWERLRGDARINNR